MVGVQTFEQKIIEVMFFGREMFDESLRSEFFSDFIFVVNLLKRDGIKKAEIIVLPIDDMTRGIDFKMPFLGHVHARNKLVQFVSSFQG